MKKIVKKNVKNNIEVYYTCPSCRCTGQAGGYSKEMYEANKNTYVGTPILEPDSFFEENIF